MAIYGNTISFGGGGQNDTLPPLLDNFRANKNEKKFIMSEHHGGNFTLFKDLPDNTTIKLTSQSNFNLFVCKGKTEAYPTLVLAGSFLEGLKFENDNSVDFQNADIIQYINGLSPEWWKSSSSNTTKPDYANSPHWLSELGFYESNRSLFEKSFLPVELNGVNYGGNRVIVPTLTIRDNYPTWKNLYIWNTGEFGCVSDDGGSVMSYGMGSGGGANREVKAPESPNLQTYFWHIFLEPNPELKVYQNSKGEYFLFDESVEITLSADKMQESRATDLAGAVWVYGDHLPKNVNDGTKTELSRDEIVADSGTIEKSVSWDKSKNFYARQFTYNPKKQYQTMTEGGLTSLNPNEFTNPRKVYEYGSVAPEDKNLIWIQPDGLAKFWNGSEWVAIAGVYA